MNPSNLGANIDTRGDKETQKDFNIKETVASFAPVNWAVKQPPSGLQFELNPTTWRKFPLQNQNGSSSCVAQTKKKMNGVNIAIKTGRYATFSATHTYQRRANRPAGGMSGIDVFEIERNGGVTLEEFAPSELLNDTQMDAARVDGPALDIAKIFLGANHVGLDPKDIEQVASTIQATGKGVMVWFYFTYAEWQDVPVVIDANLDLNAASTLRHSVTAVDYFMWNGKKALLIEDSWGEFGQFKGQRIITEDFYKARNWFARYSLGFKYEQAPEPVPPAPGHQFSQSLHFIPLNAQGEISDPVLHAKQKDDVTFLQDILKKDGCLPSNISSTGYYGAITCKAVITFQKKYGIDTSTSPEGKDVGPRTIAKLNELYGSK